MNACKTMENNKMASATFPRCYDNWLVSISPDMCQLVHISYKIVRLTKGSVMSSYMIDRLSK